MPDPRRNRFIEVRFYGDRALVQQLISSGYLAPERIAGRVGFLLSDVKRLADRLARYEQSLRMISEQIKAAGIEGR